jgi:ATP:cob(I)alamin adenosyltransferase
LFAGSRIHPVPCCCSLLDLGSHVATPLSSEKSSAIALRRTAFDASITLSLEESIDAMEATLAPLKNFILPGGGVASSALHIARTVCRRAERSVVALETAHPGDIEASVLAFLNRLSDWLFVASRVTARESGQPEVVYRKHGFKSHDGSNTIVRSPGLRSRTATTTSVPSRTLAAASSATVSTSASTTAGGAASMSSPSIGSRSLFQSATAATRALANSAPASLVPNNNNIGGSAPTSPVVGSSSSSPPPASSSGGNEGVTASPSTTARAAKKELTMTLLYAALIIGVARYIYTVLPYVLAAYKS